MKRALFLLLPAVLLVLIALVGCEDETNPKFTRLRVYPDCGVAPLNVEGLAIASGGNESGDPTGGNNNLEITWDFGDGGAGGSTSVAYHTFTRDENQTFQRDTTYTVTVKAVDPDGKTTTISTLVHVMADTLAIEASSNFPGGAATTNDTIRFDLHALACNINPDIDDDYRNLVFNWDMGDTFVVFEGSPPEPVSYPYVFSNRQPVFNYEEAGAYDVTVSVTYPELATTRYATLHFDVISP